MTPSPAASRLGLKRFAVLFAAVMLAGFGLLCAPFARPAVEAFSRLLVRAAGIAIEVSGGSATVQGDILSSPSNGFAVRMVDGCNGANVTILLWAALLAFPASWRLKLGGLAAGTLAIHAINLVRFISLYYLGQYSRAWFNFAHVYLWELLIVLDTLVIFWVWVHMVFRSMARSNASA
jgi:exosortase H (IPTLxxWG-CTERM-specific)